MNELLTLRKSYAFSVVDKMSPIEQQSEAVELLHQLKNYWQEHPEIVEKSNEVAVKLIALGLAEKNEKYPNLIDDPTSSAILSKIYAINTFNQLSDEEVTNLIQKNNENLATLRTLTGELTGQTKEKLRHSSIETAFWQPASEDEKTIQSATKSIILRLLGKNTGGIVENVYYDRSGEDNQLSGVMDNDLIFHLYDDFQLIDVSFAEVLKLNSEKLDLQLQLNQVPETAENTELLTTILNDANEVVSKIQNDIQSNAQIKVTDVSLAIRHELFAHLIDPLKNGYNLYTISEQLQALEIMTNYLENHYDEYVKPFEESIKNLSPHGRWKTINVPHIWADTLTMVTNPDSGSPPIEIP